MKRMKKILSILLSVVMVMAMGITVLADPGSEGGSGSVGATTYTIIAPDTDHQYEIYQIFTGDLSNGRLSNIKWGANGTGTTGTAVEQSTLDDLKNVTGKTDSEKLSEIQKYASLSNPVATITKNGTYSAAAGYYLIKDKDKSVTGTDAYTKYIVEVVGNVTIAPKSDVPELEKKVKDTNDSTGDTSDWQDSADYDIGDDVPFQLKGTIADNYDDYTTYYYAFHDQEETGLTFKEITSVYVMNGKTKTELNNSQYTLKVNTSAGAITDKCTFEVVFDDLKNLKSADDNAIVNKDSKIYVEYTSTLNKNAVLGNQGNVNKAKLEFSNNPNAGGTGDKGTTPWDNVIVFTYKVVIDKVDDKNQPLTGAEFTLAKKIKGSSNTQTVAVVKSEEGTEFTFKGLDDGEYTLTETVTPTGFNTINPITFTVTADHKVVWGASDNRTDILKKLSGAKVTGEITLAADMFEGSLTANVVNKEGTILPSTGGIGTTIFYVVGAILMIGAGVVLVSRRRANK